LYTFKNCKVVNVFEKDNLVECKISPGKANLSSTIKVPLPSWNYGDTGGGWGKITTHLAFV
jgi:hypothetical protein